ncbi:MAG: S-layer homology domain-containing protein [Candidatus Peregrinibacteria bacterium]
MKKTSSTFLCALLVFAGSTVHASAGFTDIPQNVWFAEYVQEAADAGIVSGYRDAQGNVTGKFGPADSVTLAQALKIAVLSAGYDPTNYSEHCLTPDTPWYKTYDCVGQAETIMPFIGVLWECYEGCTAQTRADTWNAPATRIQVAYMIARAFKVPDGSTKSPLSGVRVPVPTSTIELPFSDVDAFIIGAIELASLSREGIVKGDTDVSGHPLGRFRPYAPINRAEAAKIAMVARRKFGTPGKGRTLRNAKIDFNYTVVNMRYTNEGFGSSDLQIKQGSAINICNESVIKLKVASPEIPSMDDLAEVPAGNPSMCASFQFKFMDLGTFHIRNQYDASKEMTVEVIP